MPAKAIRNRIDIVEIVERWAKYRLGDAYTGIGWPRQVMLGKIMDGMPGTNCPRCVGRGHLHVEAEGIGRLKVDCPVCEGAGKVKLDYTPNKVNPALITGNGQRLGWNDDPVSQKVDWIICTIMTEDQRVVIIQEFTRTGTQNDKIRRLHITHSRYNNLLDEAIMAVAENL